MSIEQGTISGKRNITVNSMEIIGTIRERFWLKEMLLRKALRHSDKMFELSSGMPSHWYLDARMVMTHPKGIDLVSTMIYEAIRGTDVNAIGGPTTGAIPIASAVALKSHLRQDCIKAFWVDHKEKKSIQGPLEQGDQVIIVDDVVTSGSSILNAAANVEGMGAKVLFIVSIVDREAGAAEEFHMIGYKYVPIFELSELIDIWPAL